MTHSRLESAGALALEAEIDLFAVPVSHLWPDPLVDSTLAIHTVELITLRLTDADGRTGLGYTYTLGVGGSAVYALLRDAVLPTVVPGVIDIGSWWDTVWWKLYRVGRAGIAPTAMAPADIALHDLAGKAAGRPLADLLGRRHERLPAYASSIDLGWDVARLVDHCVAAKEQGFGAIKLKVGRGVAEDAARIRRVREVVGADVELMVDANLGWSHDSATRSLRELADAALSWIEEPLPAHDVAGHAHLRRTIGIPVAAGESLFSVEEFAAYGAAGALDVMQPDAGRLGGVTPWMRVAAVAQNCGAVIAPHFLQDLHVPLLAAIPNVRLLEHLPLLDRVILNPLDVVNGLVNVPTVPGHGVALDFDGLAPFRVTTDRHDRIDA